MTFQGTLRPYQEDAVDRMVDRGQMLLGMVMGAGKTPTTIAACEKLRRWGEIQRTLIIVPSALKYQWRTELRKFAPDSRVLVVDGSASERDKQWRMSFSAHYVLVNPESLLKDERKVGDYQCVVVDEATMIKTRYAGKKKVKRTALVKRLGKKVFYRFALTGQPIENKPDELFSIMEFVDPAVLGDWTTFNTTFIVRDHYGKPVRYRNLDLVYDSVQEAMVRYSFEDIKDQMPDVIHQVIPVQFDRKGARVYHKVANDLLEKIREAIRRKVAISYQGDDEVSGEVMTRLTTLRMLCDNPRLVNYSSTLFNSQRAGGSKYANSLVRSGALDTLTATPKLDACLDYVDEVLSEAPANKVVLFSTFKKNLDIIQLALAKRGYQSVLFTGDMNAKEKDASKEEFATDPECRVFLSSDAGGYGVDLPMANYLISYDLPWSSGKLEQREARIIRLSSEFPHVTIATFIMAGSIEERQHEMLKQKKKINEAWIDGKHHDAQQGMEIDLGTLTSFLESSRV